MIPATQHGQLEKTYRTLTFVTFSENDYILVTIIIWHDIIVYFFTTQKRHNRMCKSDDYAQRYFSIHDPRLKLLFLELLDAEHFWLEHYVTRNSSG